MEVDYPNEDIVMDPVLADTIIPLFAIIGVGTMVLIGMKLRYNYQARIAEKSGSSEIRFTRKSSGHRDERIKPSGA